jgi:tetratricopeptide (TPR) repeat protein
VRIDELLERSRTVVRLADAASDQLSFVRVMRTLVSIAHGAGEAAFICALVDEIEARANSATDDVVAAELLALAANVGCVYKSMESAITYGDRAVALANACASPPTLATSLLARGIAQLTVGRVGDARIDFQQALSLTEANDLWAYRGQILTNLGIAEIELAEFALAERSLLSVLDVAGRNESLFVWANLGALYWEIERWSQLRSVGIQLLSLSETLGVSWGVCVAESFRGLAAVGLGREDEAAVAAGRVDRLLRSSIMVADVSYGAILIARVASARSLPRAVAYLESFRDCGSTAATLSRLRIELEIADLCVAFSPQRAWSVATAVRATGESLGATSVVARANKIREAVRYER